jgi:hypothetical protein
MFTFLQKFKMLVELYWVDFGVVYCGLFETQLAYRNENATYKLDRLDYYSLNGFDGAMTLT